MAEPLHLKEEARRLLRIAGPMMLAQGGLTTMGLVDTWCVGRVSTAAMAGVALGNALALFLMVIALGVAMGMEPLAAQALGAGEKARAARWRIQAAWAAGGVALAVSLLTAAMGLVALRWGGAFQTETGLYLLGRAPGVLVGGLYGVERSFLTAVDRPRAALVAVVLANVVNLLADLGLVFGLGLGALGVGVATTLSSIAMWWWARRAALSWHQTEAKLDWVEIKRVFRLGWPIAAQLGFEVGIFSGVSGLVALEGGTSLAAHQIALGLASATFMASVGIGVAATARVGHHVGARDTPRARQVGFLALGMGAIFMATGAVIFLLFAEPLAASFAPHDAQVVALAAILLRIGAVFSVSDGLQAVAAGALRGAGDTRSTFTLNLLGHGLVGAPIGLGLALGADWGTRGYWWGLTAGLTATGLGLVLRFGWLTARPIERVELDSTPDELGALARLEGQTE